MNVLKRNKTEKFHYTLVNKETMQNEYYCDTTKVEYEIVNLEAHKEFNIELVIDEEDDVFGRNIFGSHIYKNANRCAKTLNEIKTQQELDALDINNASISFHISKDRNSCYVNRYDSYGWDLRLESYELNKVDDKLFLTGIIEMKYKSYRCPVCGEEMHYLCSYSNTASVIGKYTFDNENDIKYSTIYKEIKLLRDGKRHIRYYKDLMVHKKDTGKTYEIRGVHMSGSPFLAKKKASIKDVSYLFSREHYIDAEFDIYQNMIIKHMEEKYGDEFTYTYKDVHRVFDMTDSLKTGLIIELMYIKSKLKIKNTLLAKFIYDIRATRPSIMQDIRNMNEKGIMKYFKINHKDLTEIYTTVKGSEAYRPVKYSLVFKHIENKDHIKTLLLDGGFIIVCDPKSNKRDFMYHYAKHNSEKRIVNQLMKNGEWLLTDTVRMFSEIKAERKDYELDWSQDISALHDIISADYARRRSKNKRIASNKEISKMFKGFEHDGIEYSMPKNTHELIDIGSFMNICVGSYGELAVTKKCFIVAGYKNGEPVTCIELNKHEGAFKVNQVKKKYNRLPDIDEALALKDLFISNNVDVNTYDLKNAKEVKHLQDGIHVNEDVFIPQINNMAMEAVF